MLVIPKAHVANLLDARTLDDALLAHLLRTISNVAEQLGLAETGFRVISNCGSDACQSVEHLHFHILGGTKMPAQMV